MIFPEAALHACPGDETWSTAPGKGRSLGLI